MTRRRRPSYQEKLKEGREELEFLNGARGMPHKHPTMSPKKSSKPIEPASASPTNLAEAREIWSVVEIGRTGSPAEQYQQHRQALQDLEHEKLNRLQIMTWAQQTRTRFLRLPMADRKIFLGVLTADENGAFTKLFKLQAQLEAAGVTDAKLKLLEAWKKAEKPGANTEDIVKAVRKELAGQQKKLKARAVLELPSAEGPALPENKTLSLPGAKDAKRIAESLQNNIETAQPPRKAAGLTFSEGKMYERALLIYSTRPADAAEIRAAFHCRMVSAERIYKALKKVLCA